MTPLSFVLTAILGAGLTGTFLFLRGRLHQQRAQVLELRQTNVALFKENQEVLKAYAYLQEQVKKVQSGPVAAALGYDQINRIAEVVSAKIEGLSMGGKEIKKKDVN